MGEPKKGLLIWEEVPDQTRAFVFEIGGYIGDKILQCAGCYINGTLADGSEIPEGHPIFEVSDVIENDGLEDVDLTSPMTGPFKVVVVAGFLL